MVIYHSLTAYIETHYMSKETDYMSKETDYMSKETYSETMLECTQILTAYIPGQFQAG